MSCDILNLSIIKVLLVITKTNMLNRKVFFTVFKDSNLNRITTAEILCIKVPVFLTYIYLTIQQIGSFINIAKRHT